MKKLRCRVLGTGDWFLDKFAGQEVTVTNIDRVGYGQGTPYVTCRLDNDPTTTIEIPDTPEGKQVVKAGFVLRLCSDKLEPIEVSMVPETHNSSLLLRQIWIFHEASCDAWFRGPPNNQTKYEEENGGPWTDKRIFDIGVRSGRL